MVNSPEFREKEQSEKVPLVVIIGGGSRLPPIIEHAQQPDSLVQISAVFSHKKESPGIRLANKCQIPAFFANLPRWKRLPRRGQEVYDRETYNSCLGEFISERYFEKNGVKGLVVMVGWDLIMSEKFLKHFQAEDGHFRAINLHPALLPDDLENKEVTLSNGEKIPVLRGMHSNQAFKETLKRSLKWSGATVHFVTPEVDAGPVVLRGEVPVLAGDTVESLAARVHEKEDVILPKAIDMILRGLI